MTITYFDKTDTELADGYTYPDGCGKLTPPNHAQRVMGTFCDDVKGKVCGSRQDDYGPPHENHQRTSEGWNWYLKHCGPTIDARDVCWLNAIQKISRDLHCRKDDNCTDIAGFAANALECSHAELPDNRT